MSVKTRYCGFQIPLVNLNCLVRYRMAWRETFVERLFAFAIALLVSGIALMTILEIAEGPAVIGIVSAIAMVSVLLVYGIRINRIEISKQGFTVDFQDSVKEPDKD